MNNPKYLTVSALTKYIKYKLENDEHLRYVLLEGEVSNFKHHSRGHFYFTLKDPLAQISATMFYSSASRVDFTPKDGMTVLVEGSINLYEPAGNYQINVVRMLQKGVGSLYLAFERLKEELKAKGYFNNDRKRAIPAYPKAIGVLTSPTGAAVRDIINTVKRRYPLAKLYIYPTLVQGENAKESIVSNIELANEQKKTDILIVGRGGGSIEDMWAFNEEMVAKAIYNSAIPIISAVGHETDFTIADFVADQRAATPTAAAELATPNITALIEQVKILQGRCQRAVLNKLDNAKVSLAYLDKRLEGNSPLSKLTNAREKIGQLEQILSMSYINYLSNRKQRIALLEEKIQIYNPYNLMKKGYSIVLKNDKIIRSIADLEPTDRITIMLTDGQTNAIVEGEKK